MSEYTISIYRTISQGISNLLQPPVDTTDDVCEVDAVRKSKRLAENYTTLFHGVTGELFDLGENAVREFHKTHPDQPKAEAFNSINQGVTLFTEVGLGFLMRTRLFPEFMICMSWFSYPRIS